MPDESGAATIAARERPPRDNLVRACANGVALRMERAEPSGDAASDNANGMPTLYGYFTRFNEWTEIDSWWEGNFLERIAPGSFKKTFREQTQKVLFQHGSDPQVGDKVLGAPDVLREESEGPYYEVPLLDTTYNRDLVPALEAGLYGASFRFTVMREEYVEEPGLTEHNPMGLPERTIKEVRCSEFGPVSFPAYAGATAGVRSLTDEFIVARATREPDRLRELLQYLDTVDRSREPEPTTDVDDPAPSPSEDDERRDDDVPVRVTVIHPVKPAAPRSVLTPLHQKKGRLA